VVVCEAGDVVLQRVDAGGGQHAGLAHAPAQHLAPAPRLRCEITAATQQRADGCAQPLRRNTETVSTSG
jgi:hypothetical protein